MDRPQQPTQLQYVLVVLLLMVLLALFCGGFLRIIGSDLAGTLRAAPIPFKLRYDWPVGKWECDNDELPGHVYHFDMKPGGKGTVWYYVEDPTDPTKGVKHTKQLRWRHEPDLQLIWIDEIGADGREFSWVIRLKETKIRKN